jgi:hypothetical protein
MLIAGPLLNNQGLNNRFVELEQFVQALAQTVVRRARSL